ncbi:MAG: nickel-dependent lactate racemase [Clostridia bacterium]|nr:nickel-dependent lactate racemase [Clostridia bacterium]
MTEIKFPYGKTTITHNFDDNELSGVLTSSIEEYVPQAEPEALVRQALEAPIGSPRLCELARGKKNIVIIASDHTRPVPSRVIMPAMLSEIRMGNPDAEITILIATGCHRGTTRDELINKFGEHIVEHENIYIHDCQDREMLVNIGTLPSGGACEINKIAYDADLLVSEGFIEPHFFAGFSGGRKSVLPGIAGKTTVLANHCSEFIASEYSRTGVLADNPIHRDMLWAAKTAKLCFIVNVVLDAEKRVIYAVAGDLEQAHKKGTDFLLSQCGVRAVPADIAISTNGGYPLDQNIYQAVKGMTAAEATVKHGGVIIMLASSSDGTGGDSFYHMLSDNDDISNTMQTILARTRNETVADQWEAQILLRILLHCNVIYVSEVQDEVISAMHMIPAHSLDEALCKAKAIIGKKDPKITAIPDGIAVMVTKE